jgi:hypothetical protein
MTVPLSERPSASDIGPGHWPESLAGLRDAKRLSAENRAIGRAIDIFLGIGASAYFPALF